MSTMNEALQRWLDGDLEDHELPTELREDAERWRALLSARPDPGPAPPWLEQGVMNELPHRAPGWVNRVLDWFARPRMLQVRPVRVATVAVAILAVVLLWPGSSQGPASRATVESSGRLADGGVYVQFIYVAPEAGSVAVAGDFNDWSDQGLRLEDPDGDGIWTGQAPLSPGLHKYMFVVDGQWVTDPQADRYVDDGFGNRNALIEVPHRGGAI